MFKNIILLVTSFSFYNVVGQNQLLDSLYNRLDHEAMHDTVRILLMTDIVANEYVVNPDKARNLANQALEVAQKINYKKGEANSLRVLAMTYWSKGNYDIAADLVFKALTLFESIHNLHGVIRANYTLGQIHHQWKNFDKAQHYYLKALNLNKETGNKNLEGYLNNSLGSLWLDKELYDSSLLYYLHSLAIREKLNDEQGISQSLNNIGLVHSRLGRYETAIEYYNRSLLLTLKLNNKVREAITTRGLGETYLKMQKFDKAETLLKDALTQMKTLGDKMALMEINETLEELEELRGNYKTALFYEREKRKYQDSMFNETKSEQLASLETKFETAKKEQTILLLAKDNKIKTIRQNILAAGIGLLLLIFLAVYQTLKYRQQKNLEVLNLQIDILTAKNQELSQRYFIANTLPDTQAPEPFNQRLLQRALEIVEKNLADPLFGVEKLASEMNMSRASLHAKLKSITGFSPSDFIRNIRLKRAATLIANNVDNISQIAFKVGFEDQSYFTKVFKKQFGTTPSQFMTEGTQPA